ncbi:MAG TPA: hypothetical protein VN963_06300 [bacterium]|nr:hypothetical protein [bacterium]
MNFTLIFILSVLFIAGWAIVSYSFVRISRQTKAQKKNHIVQPAFRLADQWIMESQRKIEELSEKAEQPLSTAQHELLDLRLEAGRLPQGVKNLRTVRESLAGNIKPLVLNKTLAEIAGLYLPVEDYQVQEADFVYFKTHVGSMPILEVSKAEPLSDSGMKKWLGRLSTQANPVMGGFLYFADSRQFEVCQQNREWMEALRSYKIMSLDFQGLTALLVSFKIYQDTDRLIRTFQAGIESTVPLVGQADKMGLALTSLGASALNVQMILEGGAPGPSKTRSGESMGS